VIIRLLDYRPLPMLRPHHHDNLVSHHHHSVIPISIIPLPAWILWLDVYPGLEVSISQQSHQHSSSPPLFPPSTIHHPSIPKPLTYGFRQRSMMVVSKPELRDRISVEHGSKSSVSDHILIIYCPSLSPPFTTCPSPYPRHIPQLSISYHLMISPYVPPCSS